MKLSAAICAIILCCVSVSADAQQRDRDGGRGYGDRGYSRGYGDRSRHRYYSDRRPGYRYRQGYGWYDPSAIIGGAVGSWLWNQWAQPEPAPVRDVAWCMNRYKSYDPYTKTYLGYDGLRHGCP
jgi:hypothetical protein